MIQWDSFIWYDPKWFNVIHSYMIRYHMIQCDSFIYLIWFHMIQFVYDMISYDKMRLIHVWYNSVWFNAIQFVYDIILYDSVWFIYIWYDTIWFNVIHSYIWYDSMRFISIWYDTIWFNAIHSYIIWFRMIQCDSFLYDTIPYDSMRFTRIWFDTIRYDPKNIRITPLLNAVGKELKDGGFVKTFHTSDIKPWTFDSLFKTFTKQWKLSPLDGSIAPRCRHLDHLFNPAG